MKNINTFVRNNSFVVFVVLAYLLAWWPTLLNAGMLPQGPLFAALIVIGLIEGKAGLKAWWDGMVSHVAWGWYAVAVAIPLAITFTAAGLNILLYAQLPTQINWTTAFQALPILLLLGGHWEEPGWTGFGLPRLFERFGPSAAGTVTATLIMAVIRSTWHLPLILSGAMYWSEFVLIIGFQFVFTWLFNRTRGATLAAMICHLLNNMMYAFTGDWFTGAEGVNEAWLRAGLWCLLALGLLLLAGFHLGRKPAAVQTDVALVGQPLA